MIEYLKINYYFFLITVDYLHKASASGKIPTNFLRRDMGSTNYEILVSRMIDRSIRPLFDSRDTYNTETQVFSTLLFIKMYQISSFIF